MSRLDLEREVRAYEAWANSYAGAGQYPEWEYDYPDWNKLFGAALEQVRIQEGHGRFSERIGKLLLYAIARDNERVYLATEIAAKYPGVCKELLRLAVTGTERDAKWQLCQAVARLRYDLAGVEPQLLELLGDEDEFVRRQALLSLCELHSDQAEDAALRAWRDTDSGVHMKMAALRCLADLGSTWTSSLAREALESEDPLLVTFAQSLAR